MMETLTELEEKGKENETGRGQGQRMKRKTVSVNERTYNELKELGRYGDSASDVIDRCIESHKKILAKGE
jgi:hypothetical protein